MAPRRSQRAAAAKAAKALETVDDERSENEHEETDVTVLVLKKPRISEASRIHNPPPEKPAKAAKLANKGKRNAGKLKQLKDMPVEIFFEVTSWLRPLDLLHLSRASKYFREMFTSKSSKALWIRARRSINMPDCPESISEPHYASVIFENICQACGVSRAVKYDYSYLTRFCVACYKENFVNGKRLLKQYPKTLDRIVIKLMPRESGEDLWADEEITDLDLENTELSLEDNESFHRFYKPQFDAIADRLMTLQQGTAPYDRFTQAMRERATRMIEFNRKINLWFKEESRENRKAKEAIMDKREADILVKISELGYSQEDFPQHFRFIWSEKLYKPRPLSSKDWDSIKQTLVDDIERVKASKLRMVINARKHALMQVLQPHYDEFYKHSKGQEFSLWVPNLQGAASIKAVAALLDEDQAQVEMTPERAQTILGIVKDWCVRRNDEVEAKLLPELRAFYAGIPGYDDIPETLDRSYLHRATTIIRYATRGGPIDYTYAQLASRYSRSSHLDIVASLSISETSCQIAMKVLRMLGLPKDTPAEDLPREFVCGCLDPNLMLPLSFMELIIHLLHEDKWYKRMSGIPGSQSDPNLAVYNNHDFDCGTPFIHVYQGESFHDIDTKGWRPQKMGPDLSCPPYVCKICEKLCELGGDPEIRSPRYNQMDSPMLFVHHFRNKHRREPREDDVQYVARRFF